MSENRRSQDGDFLTHTVQPRTTEKPKQDSNIQKHTNNGQQKAA